MQAVVLSANWGSYKKAAWGMQIALKEEIVEKHVEEHTTEIEGETKYYDIHWGMVVMPSLVSS